jgi:hypothetical protein
MSWESVCDSIVNDIVGDHVRKGKAADWYRGSVPADTSVSYTVIMPAMKMGDVLWEESKIADGAARYVSQYGIPTEIRDGFKPYCSVILIDQDGLLCTFTASNWGAWNEFKGLVKQFLIRGQRDFPIIELSSKARGNQFGTIDPWLKVKGWVPASNFSSITGGDVPLAIEAPKPASKPASTPVPDRRSSADILDDDLPF